MKSTSYHILVLLSFLLLGSCVSVKQYNQMLDKQISVKNLHADVDYLHKILELYHPRLYWYISKQALDSKFDSVKADITQPMVSADFYYKIAPLLTNIRQGHTRAVQPSWRYSVKERKTLAVKAFGFNPFYKYEFYIDSGKLYVIDNKSWDKRIKSGSELIEVNHIKTSVLLDKYRHTLTSDGYIQTFPDRYIAKNFYSFLSKDFGLKDSMVCEALYADTLKTFMLYRRNSAIDSVQTYDRKVKLTLAQKDSIREENKKRRYLGFDRLTNRYSKNLTFYGTDSSTAILKINDFVGGKYTKFYKDTFKKLDALKVKNLVIDLRDNLGGRLSEINRLYSYLADSTYYSFDRSSEITSPNVIFQPILKTRPQWMHSLLWPFYPSSLLAMASKLERDNEGNYYMLLFPKKQKAATHKFNGNVYVLINGGSFSASCILSSNLKGAKRAFFVGEETGGAYSGTVAGYMPMFKLPHSKIDVRMGLLALHPAYEQALKGRGIIPDVVIIPTLADKINHTDPEMKYVLDKINLKNNDK